MRSALDLCMTFGGNLHAGWYMAEDTTADLDDGESGSAYFQCPPPFYRSVVLLPSVSVACGQPWSENVK